MAKGKEEPANGLVQASHPAVDLDDDEVWWNRIGNAELVPEGWGDDL